MEGNTKASGKRTKCMAKDHSPSQMAGIIKVHTEMIRRMEEEFTSGLMDEGMRENSTKESNMEMVPSSQKMENPDKLSSRMEKESDGWMKGWKMIIMSIKMFLMQYFIQR